MAKVLGRGGRGVRIAVSEEEVFSFLGSIPLVQQLPRTSVQRLAEVVEPLYYEEGEIVVQQGTIGGLYFLWKGEAKISFLSLPVSAGDEVTCTEATLKSGDYFGFVAYILAETVVPVKTLHKSSVTAVTEVTCLVLHNDYTDLLYCASIWAQQQEKECEVSPIERILQLETIKVDLFQGITKEDFPSLDFVFGGQLVGQALAATCKTVSPALLVHSLHAYFLRAGDNRIPILYKVERIRDGRTFSTRQVSAIQKGKVVFLMYSSFQRFDLQKTFEHQEAMPTVPSPDQLLSMEELHKIHPIERYLWEPRCPLDMKEVQPINRASKEALAPWKRTWIKTKGKLTDDQNLHRCAAAYASDWAFLETSTRPHREDSIRLTSLDHSMWFHKPLRADEWFLFVQSSPCASNGRVLVCGNFFNQHGELVVSVSQEGLMRKMSQDQVVAISKL